MKRVSGNLVSNIYLLLILWHSFIFSRSLLFSFFFVSPSLSLSRMLCSHNWILFFCRAEKVRDEKKREVVAQYTENTEKRKEGARERERERERAREREQPGSYRRGCTHSIVPKATWWTWKSWSQTTLARKKTVKELPYIILYNVVIAEMSWVNTVPGRQSKKATADDSI